MPKVPPRRPASPRRPRSATDALSAPEPFEHAHGAQGVPPAGLALAVLHLEVGLAGVHVLQRPAAVGATVPLDNAKRLVEAFLTLDAGVTQVVEPTQDVVEVPVRERELKPALVDDLACRFPPEQPPLQHVLLAAAPSIPHLGRAADRPLVLEQPLDHVDRGAERRNRRPVLDLAVPAAVGKLLAEEPIDERRHVDPEVGSGRDDVAVDAGLDLTLEEPVVVPRRVDRRPAPPDDVLADERDGSSGLLAFGIEPESPE